MNSDLIWNKVALGWVIIAVFIYGVSQSAKAEAKARQQEASYARLNRDFKSYFPFSAPTNDKERQELKPKVVYWLEQYTQIAARAEKEYKSSQIDGHPKEISQRERDLRGSAQDCNAARQMAVLAGYKTTELPKEYQMSSLP